MEEAAISPGDGVPVKNTTEKRERFDQPPFTLMIMKAHHGSTTINHLD